MKTTLTCLVVCSAIALPGVAMAAMTDAQYCEALSVEYRKLDTQATSGPQADAMAQCKAGNTAGGIPVLENVNSLPIVTPFSRPIVTPLGREEWAYPRSA